MQDGKKRYGDNREGKGWGWGQGVGRNFKLVVREGSTEKGVKSLSKGYIWEDFQAEAIGSAKALRRPGSFQEQQGGSGGTHRTNGRRMRTEGSWCHWV